MLLILGFSHEKRWSNGRRVKYFRCQCSLCGGETTVIKKMIDKTISCGCYAAVASSERNTKHGHGPSGVRKKKTPTYVSWQSMKARCHNPKATSYERYGARGITVCRRWHKFENFLADMGERPEGMTLDRRNNNRGYSKANCRWATPKQQHENRRAKNVAHR